MHRRPLSLGWLAVAALVLVACYESRDAPPTAYRDGGRAQRDAAPDDAALPRDATARGDGAFPACGDTVSPYAGTGCSAATRSCLAGCGGDPSCSDDCIAADAQCALCVDTSLARCANAAGCQSAWDTFACCARQQTPCATRSGLPLLACADACEGELVAYDECVSGVAEGCVPDLLATCGLAP